MALAFVAFGLTACAARPGVEQPHLVSMRASARALEHAGQVMQTHGPAMIDYAGRLRRSLGYR